MPRFPRGFFRIALPVMVALALVGLAVWRGTARYRPPAAPPPVLSMDQLAARALLLPVPAAKLAAVPVATTWEWPMGTRSGAFIYNAQPFLAPNPKRGGFHLGDDFNGIGQENTDLNDPIFAPADGWVAYSGVPSPGWGGVVILLHRGPTGLRQSFFGHLDPAGLAVVAGERVPRGRRLGRLALTAAVDFAHLHLEIRRGAVIDPGPGYAPDGARTSEDPAAFLSRHAGLPGLPVAALADTGEGLRIRREPASGGDGQPR